MPHQNIFGDKYFKQSLQNFKLEDISDLESKIKKITNYIKALETGRVEKTKEEAIQADFLNNFFGDILGYEYKDSTKWNLEKEYKSKTDASKPDGALGFFSLSGKEILGDVRVVVELKDALTDLDKPQHRQNDNRTPVEQAFSYSSKAGGKCKWVILSNFREIRLCHSSDQGAYEKFNVPELLQPDNLKRFFYILQKDNLISESTESPIERIFRERQEIEQSITKKFYNEYKTLRLELFTHIKANNKDKDELLLFNKTQKILDRFIFACFCEDAGLIPPYTLNKVKESLKYNFTQEENKLWKQLKGLFHSIDKGYPPLDINKFNGGLFAKDEELDNLVILDDILLKILDFSEYDFESDINVNILGHIFEQSLSDIEEIKAQIGNGKELSPDEKSEVKKNGKRKKEGIFYTPEYITRYIVKEAVGGWLEDRKNELGYYNLPELTTVDFQSIKTEKKKDKSIGKFIFILTYNDNIKKHLVFWEAYKEKPRHIKVLDPACGSGAFLNQVFDFLYIEGQLVNDKLSELRLGQLEIFELDKHILTNNIFGVDINPESVEITKLSLWLKTANKGKQLTALDDNIKCGNSLIDDPDIAGDRAFNWFLNFPTVFPNYRKPVAKESQIDIVEEPTYNYGNPESKGYEKYGFDVIISNPHYGAELSNIQIDYFKINYASFEYQVNSYVLFYEKGINLLKKNGYLAYITPATFLYQHFFKKIRAILNRYDLISLCKYQYEVFDDADVGDTVTLVMKKSFLKDNSTIVRLSNAPTLYSTEHQTPRDNLFNTDGTYRITDNQLNFSGELFIDLGIIAQIIVGIKPYQVGKGEPKQTREIVNTRIYSSEHQINETYKKCIVGKDFHRYTILNSSPNYLSYGKWLAEPREVAPFFKEKIIIRQTSDSLIGYLDKSDSVNLNNVYNIATLNGDVYSNYYLLCLINSKLLNHIYQSIAQEKGRLFAEVKKVYLEKLPIKILSIQYQQPFIDLATIMLTKNEQLQVIKSGLIQLLFSKHPSLTSSGKLGEWYNLSFSDFSKELSKQKIKLSLTGQSEWLSYFEEQKQKPSPSKK